MPESDKISRREFLGKAAAGTAAVSLGLFQSAPASGRVLGANDRINIGMIGLGGRGSAIVGELLELSRSGRYRLQIVACCDVWDKRAQDNARRCGDSVKVTRDYREILQMPEVDAVVIATPDHWHAKQSIDAMKAGKDVYCEKPMTLYWDEAKEVARVARETKRVFQCGAQSASDGRWWRAGQIVKAGGIGPIIWSQTGAFRNDPNGDWNWPIQPCRPGVDLDWDMWLGHEFGLAPKRPYDPERYSRFRKYWDYSGGLATDLLYHSLSHLLIGLGGGFPSEVVATGCQTVHGLENDNREVPDNFHTLIRYPQKHVVQMAATQENQTGVEELIRGEYATLSIEGPYVVIRPEPPFRDRMTEMSRNRDIFPDAEVITEKDGQGRERVTEIRVRGIQRAGHMENFLDCVRSREQPSLNADLAYQVMVPIALSVRAYREGRTIYFDPNAETVPGEKAPVRPWKQGRRLLR